MVWITDASASMAALSCDLSAARWVAVRGSSSERLGASGPGEAAAFRFAVSWATDAKPAPAFQTSSAESSESLRSRLESMLLLLDRRWRGRPRSDESWRSLVSLWPTRATRAPAACTAAAGRSRPRLSMLTRRGTASERAMSSRSVSALGTSGTSSSTVGSASSLVSSARRNVCSVSAADAWPTSSSSARRSTTRSTPPAPRTALSAGASSSSSSSLTMQRMVAMAARFRRRREGCSPSSSCSSSDSSVCMTRTTAAAAAPAPSFPRPTRARFALRAAATSWAELFSVSPRASSTAASAGGSACVAASTSDSTTPGRSAMAARALSATSSSSSMSFRTPTAVSRAEAIWPSSRSRSVSSSSRGSSVGSENICWRAASDAWASSETVPSAEARTTSESESSRATRGGATFSRTSLSSRWDERDFVGGMAGARRCCVASGGAWSRASCRWRPEETTFRRTSDAAICVSCPCWRSNKPTRGARAL
mmetsp:Transcript_3639/g.10730  ORF Transcript_3639/g.10730 Transcript_3639/m.10730 type:complete len:482 (+) Transcript_3639:211-1656(+)